MRWLPLLFSLLAFIQSFGQVQDRPTTDIRKSTDFLFLICFEKLDSFLRFADPRLDSVPRVIEAAKGQIDSVNLTAGILEQHIRQLDSLRSKLLHRADSIGLALSLDTMLIQRLSEVCVRLNSLKLLQGPHHPREKNTVEKVKSRINVNLPSSERLVLVTDADQSFSSLAKAIHGKIDSLNADPNALDRHPSKLDSLRSKLLGRIDSVTALRNPDTSFIKHLAQVNARLDSLRLKFSEKDLKTVSEADLKLTSSVAKIQESVNEKLNMFSEKGAKIPSINLPKVNLNTQLATHPDIPIPMEPPTTDLNVPTIETDLRGIDLQQTDLPLDGSVKIPEVPNAKTSDIKLPGGVAKIQDKLSGLSEAQEKFDGYQQDLKSLREGNLSKVQELPDAIESKVEGLDELKPLEEASQEFDAIKAKWNDPQVLKELALNKAKETAVNHFAGHEKELKAAMDKLSKLKAKIPDPEGTIDMFAKRQKFMKEKAFVERLVPGIGFQFQKQDSYWLDINPYLGFKISGYWLAGLGWNDRVAYNFHERGWDSPNRIYGLRSFLHFKLKSNLWVKAEVENMNAPVHRTPVSIEITGRDRIWSYFAGLKKDFQFSPHLRATVQTLYNVYNPKKRSPYTDRLNVRISFEFPLKKSKKAKAEVREAGG